MAKNSIILLLLSVLFFSGCANQMAPGGGEVDKIPPTIIETFPKSGTTNFHEKYFEVKFSEYIERSSAQNAIFISPALKRGIDFDWTGKTLSIEIKDTLLENTTYTVTIGTDISDYNNKNKMAEPYTIVFSTGDKIDKGKISGTVRTEKPDGVMIYSYQTDEKFLPEKIKPNYISQVGQNGKFTLMGLRDGDYKILAIRDNMKDLLYHRNEDEYGVQAKKIFLSSPQSIEVNNADFFLTKDDTIAPKISAAFMKDRNHLVVEFSEGIDSSLVNRNNFYLLDTVASAKIFPNYFFKAELKANQFYLGFKDTSSFKSYLLAVNNFKDLHGNTTVSDKMAFVYKTVKDTMPNKIVKIFGDAVDSKIDYENPVIKIQFSDGIDSIEVSNRISVEEVKNKNISYSAKKIDDASFGLYVTQKLKQGSEYTVNFDVRGYKDYSTKLIDTVYKYKFMTSSELDYSGLSGSVTSEDSTQNYIVIESIAPPQKIYKQKVDSKKKYELKKVVPGKYVAWAFKDRNNNGQYDHGSIKPFEYSEEFKYFPDTLNLRARWPVGDVNITFDK